MNFFQRWFHRHDEPSKDGQQQDSVDTVPVDPDLLVSRKRLKRLEDLVDQQQREDRALSALDWERDIQTRE